MKDVMRNLKKDDQRKGTSKTPDKERKEKKNGGEDQVRRSSGAIS